jgi:hypothetical protein
VQAVVTSTDRLAIYLAGDRCWKGLLSRGTAVRHRLGVRIPAVVILQTRGSEAACWRSRVGTGTTCRGRGSRNPTHTRPAGSTGPRHAQSAATCQSPPRTYAATARCSDGLHRAEISRSMRSICTREMTPRKQIPKPTRINPEITSDNSAILRRSLIRLAPDGESGSPHCARFRSVTVPTIRQSSRVIAGCIHPPRWFVGRNHNPTHVRGSGCA